MAAEAQHDTFTLTRHYPVPPAKVFQALTDPQAKAQWFAGPKGWEQHERRMDARVGGTERVSGKHSTGWVSSFDASYLVVIPDECLVFAYTMHIDGKLISASLATWGLQAEAGGTRLVLTEQGAFLNGYEDKGSRKEGTHFLLDALGAFLSGAAA